jgi:hypothetical protein
MEEYLGACDILKEGLFCKIGNGETTRIWGDRWVLIPTTYTIQSIPRGLDGEAKVVELIGKDRLAWDKEKLQNLFSAEETSAIMKIPINLQREDAIIWRDSPTGMFTVKSAYHGAMRRAQQLQPESSSHGGKEEVWGRLWKLFVPNAEKNFLWRACHDILPTKERLYKRKVTKDAICPICTVEVETSFHILWSCPSAIDVWNGSIKKFHKSSVDGPTFCGVVEEMVRLCDEDELRLFVSIARRIWFRRNEVVHGGPFTHPTVLVHQAMEAVSDFSAANELHVA